jgi:hypothetical protein
MPRAFDGDKSYYESLRDGVLADEAAKTKVTKKQPNRAARALICLRTSTVSRPKVPSGRRVSVKR